MLKLILLKIVSFLESVTEWMGKLIAWLSLFMVLAVVSVIILRNVFEISAIPLQESINYMHASLFMLGTAFALKHNAHVRVDIFYQKFSPKRQALVDMLGFLFLLLPVCLFIYFYCIDYVLFNWMLKEGSNQPGGLPYLYILKSLLLVMPISLIIQGLAQFLHNLMFYIGWAEMPYHLRLAPQELAKQEASHV